MTIQLIPAFDNNPPKFHRLPKPGKGFKRYVKVMGIIIPNPIIKALPNDEQ